MSHSFYDADPDNDALAETTSNLQRIVKQVAADPLLVGAIASMGLALGLELAGRSKAARFVGLWAPTLMLIGLYRQGTAAAGDDDSRRQAAAARELEEHFQGGCSAPPDERSRSRSIPHKAK